MKTPKTLLLTAGIASAVPAAAAGVAPGDRVSAPAERPNVLLILVDDQGYGGVSCYPHNRPTQTPHIDRLAAEGAQFMQGYTSGFLSAPTRAGLLTGCYQQTFGFYGLSDPPAGGIPRTRKILSEYLRDAGYATAAIGKWHVGDYVSNHPNNRGFDYFYGFVDGAHDYFSPIVGGSWNGWYNGVAYVMENMEPVAEMQYATYEYTDRAIDFIERNADRPFFVYLPYNAIHSPLQAPAELVREVAADPAHPTAHELVQAMTLAVDRSVGRLMETLDRNGLSDNTIVIYLSDNGGVPSGDNWDFRGRKGSYYEGGIRVPFIMRWPARIPAGQRIGAPVSSLDLAPTVLAAAGVRHGAMDGVDLLPFLRGESRHLPHDVLYWTIELADAEHPERNTFAIREGRWKLVSDPRIEKDCDLYDIEADPLERHGLKEAYPEKYRELFAKYVAWARRLPEGLSHGDAMRLDGKALMGRYVRNYEKRFGRRPDIRVVDAADPAFRETGYRAIGEGWNDPADSTRVSRAKRPAQSADEASDRRPGSRHFREDPALQIMADSAGRIRVLP